MTMIERVARALWEECWGLDEVRSISAAKAAILAMREPTDAMIRHGFSRDDMPAQTWVQMIDAALNEKSE